MDAGGGAHESRAGPAGRLRTKAGGAAVSGPTGDLTRRLAVAGVGIPLCVAVTWVGGWVFVTGVAVLATVSAREYLGLFGGAGGRRPLRTPTLVGAAAFPLLVHLLGPGGAWLSVPAFLMVLGPWALATRPPEEGPVASAALSAFGVLYLGGLLGFAVPLRGVTDDAVAGTLLFFLPVTVTWIADTAAYFGGRRFGRRKLAPRVSPNKTWAGAVSALVAGPLAALAYRLFLLPLAGTAGAAGGSGLSPMLALLLGSLVAGAAILGDLVESALKRECDAKDSSNLLPGHGGLLDRLDSLLWTIPVAYVFLRVLA